MQKSGQRAKRVLTGRRRDCKVSKLAGELCILHVASRRCCTEWRWGCIASRKSWKVSRRGQGAGLYSKQNILYCEEEDGVLGMQSADQWSTASTFQTSMSYKSTAPFLLQPSIVVPLNSLQFNFSNHQLTQREKRLKEKIECVQNQNSLGSASMNLSLRQILDEFLFGTFYIFCLVFLLSVYLHFKDELVESIVVPLNSLQINCSTLQPLFVDVESHWSTACWC